MNIQFNRDWIQSLVISLPEYADDLGKQIQIAMTENMLDTIDAHACALGVAIADKNAELAFEIAMSDILLGNDIREEVAKTVIDLSMDKREAVDNPKLYTLAIAYVLNDFLQITEIINKLTEEGVDAAKIEAVHRIAKLIPTVSRCVI